MAHPDQSDPQPSHNTMLALLPGRYVQVLVGAEPVYPDYNI